MEQLTAGGWIAAHVAMGLALAATAGLRAFLPPLVVGLAARLGWVSLPETFDWLSSTPALVVFGAALVAELVGDKVPIVDHALDVMATLVKPVAGGFVMWSVTAGWSPLYLTVIAIVLGGGLAGGVHAVKSQVRLASTTLTGGLANPVISAVEDATAFVTSVLAILVPILAAVFIAASLAAVWWLVRRWRRRAAPAAALRHSA